VTTDVGSTQIGWSPEEQIFPAEQLSGALVHDLGPTVWIHCPPEVCCVKVHCCVPVPPQVFEGAVQVVQFIAPVLQLGFGAGVTVGVLVTSGVGVLVGFGVGVLEGFGVGELVGIVVGLGVGVGSSITPKFTTCAGGTVTVTRAQHPA